MALHGVASESLANCFAYQSGVGVAEKLGVSPSTAEGMMREQLAENGALYADNPAYLIPSGCRTAASTTCIRARRDPLDPVVEPPGARPSGVTL